MFTITAVRFIMNYVAVAWGYMCKSKIKLNQAKGNMCLGHVINALWYVTNTTIFRFLGYRSI